MASVSDRFAIALVLLVRQQKSLMPELLLRDSTAQDAADLVAFVASLK